MIYLNNELDDYGTESEKNGICGETEQKDK